MNNKILLFLLILITVFPAQLSAQNDLPDTKLTVSFDGITIKQALSILEKETNFSFAYNSSITALNDKISKNYKDKTLTYILDDLLSDKDLGYKMIGGKITIYNLKNRKNKVRVSGYIYDAETGDVIIGCNVYGKESLMGTSSNRFGFYNLLLANDGGPKEIVFSFIGYKKVSVIVSDHDTLINVKLPIQVNLLQSVEIKAKHSENIEIVRSSAMGVSEMSAKEIRDIPPVAGEVDLLKSITVLPGIKPGSDGSAGFYVRGGSIDQNLILLDGVPIYNPYHLWGFLSSFNPDAVNNVTITKGAFPARYGGRLSSVVDITMKEGNNQKWTGDFTIGLLSAKASVSGPVVKDKASIMITARRTYADLIIVPIRKIINSDEGYKEKEGYNFTDLNLKFNYKLSDKDRLYVSGFYSRDKYYREAKDKDDDGTVSYYTYTGKGWGNAIASMRWNHLFKKKIFVNTTAYFSSYNYYNKDKVETLEVDEGNNSEKKNAIEYNSDISDFSIKQDYQFIPSNKHNIRFGLGGIYHIFKPGINAYYAKTDEETINNKSGNDPINTWEFFAYAEDDWDIARWLRLNAGVHFSSFLVENTSYYSVQPRLSVRFQLNNRMSLKAGYAHMTQYVHLLTTSGLTQSSDLWVPTTAGVKPEYSRQISVGTAMTINKIFLLEVEGYYKTMENVIEYKNSASFLEKDVAWEDKITSGDGTAYGVEFFFKKTTGKLTGFVGYTLSWSERLFDDLNFGKTFPFRYDRRHDVSVVGNYRFNDRWSMNMVWVYYTGNAVTVPTDAYVSPDYNDGSGIISAFPGPNSSVSYYYTTDIFTNSPARNNYRLPAYHRLDVTASLTKPKKWGEWELMFGITNLYNHMNASYYYGYEDIDTGTDQITMKYKQVTLFPIMPTLSYRIKF
jgi:outer membrane receptor for ferrienterochelin and colicin